MLPGPRNSLEGQMGKTRTLLHPGQFPSDCRYIRPDPDTLYCYLPTKETCWKHPGVFRSCVQCSFVCVLVWFLLQPNFSTNSLCHALLLQLSPALFLPGMRHGFPALGQRPAYRAQFQHPALCSVTSWPKSLPMSSSRSPRNQL